MSTRGDNLVSPHRRSARQVSPPLVVKKTKTISNDFLQSCLLALEAVAPSCAVTAGAVSGLSALQHLARLFASQDINGAESTFRSKLLNLPRVAPPHKGVWLG